MECRFIRITQTDDRAYGFPVACSGFELMLTAVEFFGAYLTPLKHCSPVMDQLPPGRLPSHVPAEFMVGDQMDPTRDMNGIIARLTERCHGNVHDRGIVKITSNSVYDGAPEHAAKNVADLSSGWEFASDPHAGQWICWDFRNRRVQLTHYQIRASVLGSWVVEGSMDGRRWTALDRQRPNAAFTPTVRDVISGFEQTALFAVSNRAECRFIRLFQTEPAAVGHLRWTNALVLLGVEFFGTISE
jgi:hypothetical protein